ncbi:MAG: hypothetical protein LOX97_00100, partial [Sphingomonas sp.]|nr:hypothetical protein [Sphingomonas sp.]
MAEVFIGPDVTGDGVQDADITPSGSFVNIGGIIFTDAANTGSGTGNYNTFLAVQDNDGVEQGFNSDDTPPIDDSNENIDHAKTHTVKLSDLVVVTIDGVQYYEFRVDLNEANSDPNAQISLDQFKLYTSSNGSITDTTTLFSQNLIYDLDGGGNVSVLLSDIESTGSGSDDYAVLVPVSEFAGLDPTETFVYLYVQMGAAGTDWQVNATFEEWNLQNGVTLTGTKFEDLDGDGIKDPGEGPIEGVTIFIDANQNGMLDVGERTTLTDAEGNYTFHGVATGQTVWIDEVVPAGATQTTGDHEEVVIGDNAEAGSTIIVDPIGNFIPDPELSITKNASVPGDCADTVGELITYTVILDNSGNVALDTVVLTDAFEGGSDVTLTVTGDANMNGTLDVGEVWLSGDTGNDGVMGVDETWTYTYVRAVTQADIDGFGGGDGVLENTATANANAVISGEAADEVSDDASVDVCHDPALDISKDASVPGDCADTVGELITYTVMLDNIGNVALDTVVLTDAFEGGSDVTLTVTGDANMNGTLDVGEVWLSGDTGNDGVMGVDETWTYTYVRAVTQADIDGFGGGDGVLENTATANANAVISGEAADEVSDDASVDVCHDPALDISKDASVPGDCADTVGELISYTIMLDNIGNVALENVVLEDNFEGNGNVTLTVTGDANMNGTLDVGEVWLSGDTGNDGVMVDISKDASVPGDCADTVGELITYTVMLDNIGNVALDTVVLTDAFEGGSDVTLTVTGDANMNGTLDVGEVWL